METDHSNTSGSEQVLRTQTLAVARALEQSHGKEVDLPFDSGDVGGQLMQTISAGLYPDSRDALRELAQNAYDGGAEVVDIVFDGFNVQIHDDAGGMSLPDLIRARRFGMSTKDPRANVGFQGIGLYSAFNICDEMKIVTCVADSEQRYTLRFDFAKMRAILKEQGARNVSLAHLMHNATSIGFERISPKISGETVVYLNSITDTAYHDLSDWMLLEEYLIARLPVRYDPKFPHADKIETALREKVPGYRSFTVRLQNMDSGDRKTLFREFPDENFVEPEIFSVAIEDEAGNKRTAAIAWATWAANVKMAHEAAGILFKARGFTIGDRELGRRMFTRPGLYEWFIGEIWVIEPLEPNAARTDFKPTPEKRALDQALQAQVGKRLTNAAEKLSRVNTAKKRYAEITAKVDAFRQAAAGAHGGDASTMLRDVYECLGILEKQKLGGIELESLEEQKPVLRAALQKVADDLISIQNRQPATMPTPEKQPNATTTKTGRGKNHQRKTTRVPRSLREALAIAGFDGEVQQAMDIVQAAADDVLSEASRTALYAAMLKHAPPRG